VEGIYANINNNTPKEDLIKTEYSLEQLDKRFSRTGLAYTSYALSIRDIHQEFPVECLRKVSKKFYYIVYRVKEGGYLYVYLCNPFDEEWDGKRNVLEHRNSYYMVKKSDNIKNIKKGDDFRTVSSHDKNISGGKFNFFMSIASDTTAFSSIHLTSNKLYIVYYEKSEDINALKDSKVKKIEENENFIIIDNQNQEYSYKLLKIDE